jgi:hypothetical protein
MHLEVRSPHLESNASAIVVIRVIGTEAASCIARISVVTYEGCGPSIVYFREDKNGHVVFSTLG